MDERVPVDTAAVRTQQAKRLVTRTMLLIGAVVTVLIVATLVAAFVVRPDGTAVVDNPATIIVAIITGLGGLSIALAPLFVRLLSSSEAVKQNVQNDHKKADGTPLLLRDDMDEKHDEQLSFQTETRRMMMETMSDVRQAVNGVASDIRGLRKDVGRIDDRQGENRKDIETMLRYQDAADRLHQDFAAQIAALREGKK